MILFIGPPGCGKGTQSTLFKKNLNFNIFSFGDFFRQQIELETAFGKKISLLINEGSILKTETIFDNIDLSIFNKHNLILDGFPRDINQAIFFYKFINDNNLKIDIIIEFDLGYNLLLKRIIERKICYHCNLIYSKNNIICKCGNKIQKRSDDTIKIFSNRFKTYSKNKKSIFEYYKDKTNYQIIDASGSSESIFEQIKLHIDNSRVA